MTGPIPDAKDLQNDVRNRIPAAATLSRATRRNTKKAHTERIRGASRAAIRIPSAHASGFKGTGPPNPTNQPPIPPGT